MNIKAIAAAAVLSTAAIFALPLLKQCPALTLKVAPSATPTSDAPPMVVLREYYVGWSDGTRTEAMEVHCDGRNMLYWESVGPLTEGQARYLATEFCALPNG